MSQHIFNLTGNHSKKTTQKSTVESQEYTLPEIGTWTLPNSKISQLETSNTDNLQPPELPLASNSQLVPDETHKLLQSKALHASNSQPVPSNLNISQSGVPLVSNSQPLPTPNLTYRREPGSQHFGFPGRLSPAKDDLTGYSIANEIQNYKRVLQDDYHSPPMKYSKLDDQFLTYQHVDRGYGYHHEREFSKRSGYQDNTQDRLTILDLKEKVKRLEYENQQYQKKAEDLEGELKSQMLQSHELVDRYKQKNAEDLQEFFRIQKVYEDTIQKVIHGNPVTDKLDSKSKENERKLMKSLTALDVIEQSETKKGVNYSCVIHGVSTNFKFQIHIPNDPALEVEYMPDLTNLSADERSRLPEFLLDAITFEANITPVVFWRLASSLQNGA